MMLEAQGLCLLICLFGTTNALYKQWIPDTNYENETNWEKGIVPCGNDKVLFSAQSQVSVYVETTHSVQEMRLPVNGEFILNSGAGFYIGGGQEHGCGAGATIQFKESESLRWFDPDLWRAASSRDDLEKRRFLFSVHEESVPCQDDDVIFKPRSSFRVDTTSDNPSIPVQSVSVLGKTFGTNSEFSQYLHSHLGQLQFHGSSSVQVGGSGCSDPSGCECGNSVNRERICSSVTCPSLPCAKPLHPAGHCCNVCGAIVTLQYVAGFNLQSYRQRLENRFLVQSTYKSVQMGMSKVMKSQWFMRIVPLGTSAEIQVVVLDGETGRVAEALARDILKDVQSYGSSLGIAGAEILTSSDEKSNGGVVAGAVIGVLILLTIISLGAVLVRKGMVRIPMPSAPSLPSLSIFRRNANTEELGGTVDHGFDNPIFDDHNALPTLYGNGVDNPISLTQSGVYFINPSYDENETQFNI